MSDFDARVVTADLIKGADPAVLGKMLAEAAREVCDGVGVAIVPASVVRYAGPAADDGSDHSGWPRDDFGWPRG